MFNLFKNVVRSFKKNKLSICGLSFLVFLSVGMYTALSGSTSAINKEYNYVSKTGNLHDFTVSELYDVGVVKYNNNVEKLVSDPQTSEDYSCLYDQNLLAKVNITDAEGQPTLITPYVTISEDSTASTAYVTIKYTVDIIGNNDDSTLKKFYLDSWIQHLNNPTPDDTWDAYNDILEPTFSYTLKNIDADAFNYFKNRQARYGKDYHESTPESLTQSQYNTYFDALNINENTQAKLLSCANDLYNIVSQENAPIREYLKNLSGVSDFRQFTSLNIDNSSDDIYYKVIKSSPNDTIDKVVPIDPKNGDNKIQWNNFSVSDCTYGILDYQANNNWSLNQTLKYIPESIGDDFDIHYIEKIYLLNKGDWTETPGAFKSEIDKVISGSPLPTTDSDRQTWWEKAKPKLQSFLKQETQYYSELVYCKDDRVTIQWTEISTGLPSAWSMSNWTSYFAVVNPEFLKENNLHTFNPSTYNQEESYKEYVGNNPGITDQKQLFIGWMNTLDWPTFNKWFESVQNNAKYKDQFIIPGGANPYLIIGSGISPDFIYPIVSIEKSTPNPKSECIYYVNTAGYGRIYDSFRNNLNENYIVGKFTTNDEKQQQALIDAINEQAAKVMIYPKGTKAAYLADDTTNVLNASSYRIAYIPKFVEVINLTSISLTLFIILLSLVICGIVIHRYITSQQSTLGIMRANGFSSKQIATSMLPFAMLPAIIGTASGAIVGTLIQFAIISLFGNYWMLPTPLLGFNWIGFIGILVITLAIFIATVYFTSLYVLKKNTVDLMKTDNQATANLSVRSMKKVFGKFGIMTKFRVSVAFNSIWKLLVLVIMSTLSLSTLVFTFSINGRFAAATSLTNESRNYNYAIDLVTPTTQGGQYVGINYDNVNSMYDFGFAGLSGFNQAGNDVRDINYIQSLYYGAPEQGITITTPMLPVTIKDLKLPGITYKLTSTGYQKGYMPKKVDLLTNEEHDLNYFLNKKYYFSSMLFNYFNINPSVKTSGPVNDYFDKYKNDFQASNDAILSNLYIPFMGDSYGQQTDMFYLKDRMLTSTALNYTVGALGSTSNPWDIAASLMPDNSKKLLEKSRTEFLNFIGNAINYEDGTSDVKYKQLHDLLVNAATETGDTLDLYKKFIIKSADDDQYTINKGIVVGDNTDHSKTSYFNVALRPSFLKLLSTAYSYIETAKTDYYVTYNTIPLSRDDETYTYVDANVASDNANVKIMGIKTGDQCSKYIKLYDKQNNNLNDGNNSVIKYTQEQFENDYKSSSGTWSYDYNKPFPIIVNAYAAHQYNLKIGSQISFTINNHVDRYLNKITSNDTKYVVNFVVKGICTTYEGQEYYIDQDVANLLLGLKTHLLDGEYDQDQYIQNVKQPNSFYGYEYQSLEDPLRGGFDTNKPTSKQGVSVPGGEDMLINLSNYDDNMHENGEGYNLTPYGFNGVFTKATTGGPILSNGIILYAATGIYPGNDKINSEVTQNVLSYGANLEIFRQVVLNGDETLDLSKNIKQAYDAWQQIDGETDLTEKEQKHNQLAEYAKDAIELIRNYFGDQSYSIVISSVSDAVSSQLVFDNLSNTINNTTYAVITIVSLMVIIIVALITNMVINDSKRLAALLKTLGYTDGENTRSFLAIYLPVVFFSLIISILLSWGLIGTYNALIFKGMGIWLDANIKWYDYLISTAVVSVIFSIAGLNSYISLKRSSLIELIK